MQTTDTIKTAIILPYDAGWLAQMLGVRFERNPHAEGSREYHTWMRGWQARAIAARTLEG